MIQTWGLNDIAVTVNGHGAGTGLLIEPEHECEKGDGPRGAAAGLGTYALLVLAGEATHLIGTTLIVVAGLFFPLTILTSYRRTAARDPI